MTALDEIQKWLVHKATVIRVDMAIAANKRQVDQETVLASGVECYFDRSVGSLEQTMLGQQRVIQRRIFFRDEPEIKATYRIRDEGVGIGAVAGETYTVLDAFKYRSGHQEVVGARNA
jgi:hypothetical protein